MRKIVFGSYDTWTTWGLTLTSYSLSAPSYKSSFVSVPGRDGDLDLSTALTDGEPRYNNREFTATFEISTGTRDTREALFSQILNALDGRRMNVTTPDDVTHYITGRLQVAVQYNDPAHGALTITGNCEPWRFANIEKVATVEAQTTAQSVMLANEGRRIVSPSITVTGGSITISHGSSSWTLSAGSYSLPDLQLVPGNNFVVYTGSAEAVFRYREALL